MAFPRLAPAMITLVTRGESGPDQQALLARGVQWTVPMFSCLAGFVEPGESLESAVIREVREEVGVSVANPRYQGSQPWPFPHSLMIGFRADYESGEIACDPTEIAEANWYRRDDLPMIPPGISIARKLIDGWVDEADVRATSARCDACSTPAALDDRGDQRQPIRAAHYRPHRPGRGSAPGDGRGGRIRRPSRRRACGPALGPRPTQRDSMEAVRRLPHTVSRRVIVTGLRSSTCRL